MRFFWCSYWYQNSIFLEFWLLLSQVAPYYSSLPRTVILFTNLEERDVLWFRKNSVEISVPIFFEYFFKNTYLEQEGYFLLTSEKGTFCG